MTWTADHKIGKREEERIRQKNELHELPIIKLVKSTLYWKLFDSGLDDKYHFYKTKLFVVLWFSDGVQVQYFICTYKVVLYHCTRKTVISRFYRTKLHEKKILNMLEWIVKRNHFVKWPIHHLFCWMVLQKTCKKSKEIRLGKFARLVYHLVS